MSVKFKILILLLSVPVLVYSAGGDNEFKRTIVKEFSVSNGANLEIINKYGKVVVHTWARNEVKATIVVTGYGKSPEEAREIANMVDVAASGGARASLVSVYNPGGRDSRWFNFGNKKNSKDYVNIDYDVYIPQGLSKLELENSFGSVITDALPFPARMQLNYCNYDIKQVQKMLEMNVNYCDKGKIGRADAIVMRANYSNVRIEQATSVSAHSNYSKYEAGAIGSFDIKANYDDYTISKLGSIVTKTNYTDFAINELSTEVQARLVYSDFDVKGVSTAFKGGDMDLTYSDVTMGIPQKANIKIEVNLSRGDLKTGELSLKNINSIKKNSQLNYSALLSGASEQSPLLRINGSYGDVKLSAR